MGANGLPQRKGWIRSEKRRDLGDLLFNQPLVERLRKVEMKNICTGVGAVVGLVVGGPVGVIVGGILGRGICDINVGWAPLISGEFGHDFIGADRMRGGLPHNATPAVKRQAVGKIHDFGQVGRDQYHRHPLFNQPANDGEHLLTDLRGL